MWELWDMCNNIPFSAPACTDTTLFFVFWKPWFPSLRGGCSAYYCLKACFVFLLSGPVALTYAAFCQLPQWYKALVCTLLLHHSYSGYCTGAWNQTIGVQVSPAFLTYCVPGILTWTFIKKCIWKMPFEETNSKAHNILKKCSPTLLLPRVSNTTRISLTESSGKVPCSSRNFLWS